MAGAGNPGIAHANPRDEAAMAQVGQAIDDLWSFVDDSSNVNDEQFFAEFAQRAAVAESAVDSAYKMLAATTETGRTGEAVMGIEVDVGTIERQLQDWRSAALQKDITAFETANDNLGATVDLYNHHIDAYNAAKNGNKSVYEIVRYAVGPVAAFALCCFLLAWAVYCNQKEDDVAKELQRRLRWYGVLGAAGMLLATAIPAGLFFFTDIVVPAWTWFLAVPGLAVLLYTMFRYLQTIYLARRHS